MKVSICDDQKQVGKWGIPGTLNNEVNSVINN